MKERIIYQWQVLRWSGCIAMGVLFIGILSAFFDAYVCADVAVETGDGLLAIIGLLCGVGGLILTWSAIWLWKEYEKYHYKQATSGGKKGYE